MGTKARNLMWQKCVLKTHGKPLRMLYNMLKSCNLVKTLYYYNKEKECCCVQAWLLLGIENAQGCTNPWCLSLGIND